MEVRGGLVYAFLRAPAPLGEQYLCIFTCAGAPGEQDLYIFTCSGASGEQDLCIFTCSGAPGEQDLGSMHFYTGLILRGAESVHVYVGFAFR